MSALEAQAPALLLNWNALSKGGFKATFGGHVATVKPAGNQFVAVVEDCDTDEFWREHKLCVSAAKAQRWSEVTLFMKLACDLMRAEIAEDEELEDAL